jgi:hypothetical protein
VGQEFVIDRVLAPRGRSGKIVKWLNHLGRADDPVAVPGTRTHGFSSTTVLDEQSSLADLRAEFLATSTQSMPIAGIVFWLIVAIAGMRLTPRSVAFVVGFGSGAIFPFALVIDKLRGRPVIRSTTHNPVVGMFVQSLVMVGVLWPFVITAAVIARDPRLVVLGGAILMAIVWIPYGWAANDRVGIQHAVARSVLSYAAFLLVPKPYTASAIACVVMLCYGYSLARMRRPPRRGPARS